MLQMVLVGFHAGSRVISRTQVRYEMTERREREGRRLILSLNVLVHEDECRVYENAWLEYEDEYTDTPSLLDIMLEPFPNAVIHMS